MTINDYEMTNDYPPWLPNPDPEPSGRGGTGSPFAKGGKSWLAMIGRVIHTNV
jgi:hypothetical protein